MSQLDLATTRTPAVRVPAAARRRPQPTLRVVTGAQARTTHTAFGVFCAILLAAGLLGLLLLNTARAEQSFALDDLQKSNAALTDNEQQLNSELSSVSAPEQLALRAQEMGMKPSGEVTYLRASDRKVLGVAKRDATGAAFTVNTLPATPASGVAAKAVVASSTGIAIKPPPKPAAKAPAGGEAKSKAAPKTSEAAKPGTTKTGATQEKSAKKGASPTSAAGRSKTTDQN